MPPLFFRFELIERRLGHDLQLRLGSHRTMCDYGPLLDDERYGPGLDTIPLRLVRLLDQWLSQLRRLRTKAGTALLPYDFSDQSTGWLRVVATTPERISVEAGWSAVDGYSVRPLAYLSSARRIKDFQPIVRGRQECPLEELIAAVEQARAAFAAA